MVTRGFLRQSAVTLAVVFVGVIAWIGAAGHAQAAVHSSIVIDAQTGQVVSEHDADAQTYPASLTKMMTLYLTFDALKHHALTLDQQLPVSAHAAAQEPTKLNLVAGETVSVHNLILGLVTQSANDAAVVLAEGIAGSEPAFARRMTATAHAMGMIDTNFDNASGLPDRLNHTTARDLAMLARRLYLDFPSDFTYFSTEEFKFHGVTYTNHNHLMNSFAGMDGIKTGFIRASGFNLAASAVRNGRRLIGIVMGGVSAHARDMRMAALLDAAFAGEPAPGLMVAAAKPARSRLSLHLIAHHAAGTLAKLSPIATAEAATAASPHWIIQLGPYRQHVAAVRAAAATRAHVAAARGKPMVVIVTHTRRGAVYHSRILDMTEAQAQYACRAVHREHRACAVLKVSAQVALQKSGGATPLARS